MKDLNTRQRIEAGVALGLVLLALILGFTGVFSQASFLRLLIGIGFGYALTRGDYGFAGLSNQAYRTGSAKLLRALLLMFVVSAGIVGAFMIGGKVGVTAKPLSFGLLIGGIMFGIGMAFSSCCASGALQDTPSAFSRAIITMIFFGLGVFVGWPLMEKSIVTKSLITSSDRVKGVSFVDWFSKGGTNMTNGVIGALIVTIALAIGAAYLTTLYEKAVAHRFTASTLEVKEEKEESTLWERLFVKKWSLTRTALVISVLFGLLYAAFSSGWGASNVYGNWFASVLKLVGIRTDNVLKYGISGSLFDHAMTWQNIGIILGAFINLLLAGSFTRLFKEGLKIKPLEIVLFAVGGTLMGLGSRFAMGCNLGGVYTPIANFSLSGWIYLAILFGSGYVGNMLRKIIYDKVINR